MIKIDSFSCFDPLFGLTQGRTMYTDPVFQQRGLSALAFLLLTSTTPHSTYHYRPRLCRV